MPSRHHYLALYQANAHPAPSPRIVIGQGGPVQYAPPHRATGPSTICLPHPISSRHDHLYRADACLRALPRDQA